MSSFDHDRLRPIGLTPGVLAWQHATLDPARHSLARITEVQRETVLAHDGGVIHMARPAPQLAAPLVVGDWVALEGPASDCWVTLCMPPATVLARRRTEGTSQALVHNVDLALLVMGLDGDFNPRRLERFLALAQGNGVMAAIVLTKSDVGDAQAAIDLLRTRLPGATPIVAVDARSSQARETLAPMLSAGTTAVLLGASGAGKSTLTNTLLGQTTQDTGAVRAHDSRGRHTTTSRSLFVLASGGCLIDTPGLRTLRLDLDEAALANAFDDIASSAQRCRFRDCRHQDEPGCAVRAAVSADRLHNYHKLQREARRDTLTALQRRELRSEWKARSKSVRAWMKEKRGG